jgi:hypothetical protein
LAVAEKKLARFSKNNPFSTFVGLLLACVGRILPFLALFFGNENIVG